MMMYMWFNHSYFDITIPSHIEAHTFDRRVRMTVSRTKETSVAVSNMYLHTPQLGAVQAFLLERAS